MKNYIDFLTEDELRFVCGRIGGKVLRTLYKKNGIAFSKLKRGFHPGALTDEEAYSFACLHKNAPFIARFLNVEVDKWLQKIREAKELAMQDGMKESIALVETLANSVFDERPSLYFKILVTNPPIDDEDFLTHAVKLACERNRLSHAAADIDGIDNKLEQLRLTYEAEIQARNAEYQDVLEAEKKEVEVLQSTIEQYKNKLESAESSNYALEEELKMYKELSAHAAEEEEIQPSQGFQYASLCVTYVDDFGKDRLRRVADVREGELSEKLIKSAPKMTNLYRRDGDGPAYNGAIGIWDWKVTPNWSNPTKDYYHTSYNDNMRPVEVKIIKGCNSVDGLLEKLKNGIPVILYTERVLFSIFNGWKYESVYCDSEVLDNKSGIVSLKEEVLKLPVYIFFKNHVLLVEKTCILRRINLGLPKRLVRVKEPIEIVQNCIFNKVTKRVSQEYGFVCSEYQKIKAFLKDLQTADLYDEVRKKCDCSLDEAVEYVTVFMNRADKIIMGNTIENNVMVQIIKNDPDAYAGCMSELRKVWEQENTAILAEARESLEAVKKDEARRKQNVEKKMEELSEIQKRISENNQELGRQKEMAEEVKRLVCQKIEHAKNDAAEFISNSIFSQAMSPMSATSIPIQLGTSEEGVSLFKGHKALDSDDHDINETYEDLLLTVKFELCEAGVTEEYADSLASLLYGAYIRRIPILLAGPNGYAIAEAFSVALDSQTAAVFTCTGIENVALAQCESYDKDIVVIENPLQAHWENNVIRLISKRERFYILTQSFADDLVVEPRGLFNYCLPVLTEIFVTAPPTKNYVGGKLSAAFKHYFPATVSRKYGKILDELKITSLARENIQALITDIEKFTASDDSSYILQLLLYPLAYAIGEQHTLIEKIDALENKPSTQVITKLKRLIGEEE